MWSLSRSLGWKCSEQLVADEGVAQLALEVQALGHALPHRGVEDHHVVATPALGVVDGGVGVADELLGHPDARRLVGDAHRGGHGDLGVPDVEGLLEHQPGALTEVEGAVLVGEAGHHDHELVTAEAADEVAGTHPLAEPLGDRDEQVVTDPVAHAVVDQLEAVDVDVEQGHRAGPVDLVVQRPGDVLGHERAVRQAGERVVGRLVGQAGLGLGVLAQRPPHPEDPDADEQQGDDAEGDPVADRVGAQADEQHDDRQEQGDGDAQQPASPGRHVVGGPALAHLADRGVQRGGGGEQQRQRVGHVHQVVREVEAVDVDEGVDDVADEHAQQAGEVEPHGGRGASTPGERQAGTHGEHEGRSATG